MILDDKGRIFGRMNIVDIAIVAIMILSLFIALKLIFFPVNYFQYDYLDAEINYSYIPKQNLSMFSIGRNSIYDDNDSYMVVPEGKQVDCYIDIFTQKIMDPISNESGWITLIKRHDICYFTKSSPYSGFNEDRLNEAMEKSNVVCEENVEDLDYSEFIIPGNSTYLCKALFLFKLKVRIIDGEPYYPQYKYHISKGEYADMKIGNIELYEGGITSVVPSDEG